MNTSVSIELREAADTTWLCSARAKLPPSLRRMVPTQQKVLPARVGVARSCHRHGVEMADNKTMQAYFQDYLQCQTILEVHEEVALNCWMTIRADGYAMPCRALRVQRIADNVSEDTSFRTTTNVNNTAIARHGVAIDRHQICAAMNRDTSSREVASLSDSCDRNSGIADGTPVQTSTRVSNLQHVVVYNGVAHVLEYKCVLDF